MLVSKEPRKYFLQNKIKIQSIEFEIYAVTRMFCLVFKAPCSDMLTQTSKTCSACWISNLPHFSAAEILNVNFFLVF
jgi:hypothetical protein